jgi:hypothetical protein
VTSWLPPDREKPLQESSGKRPRTNRVSPFGAIEATPFRGKLLGNRGDLHAPDGTLGRTWLLERWISCALHSPTGYRVSFDTPGRYYPLFFSDEAVALAAGHRPCASCRRPAYDLFRDGWQNAFGTRRSAPEMDAILHHARIDGEGRQRTFSARLSQLPAKTFIALPGAPRVAHLWFDGYLHPWSHAGYGPAIAPTGDHLVDVLTPAPIIEMMRLGWSP